MNKKENFNKEAIKKAAEICGSLAKLSISINGSYTSVYKWSHGKTVPSPLSCMKIEKATKGKVKKEDIRPDFNWEDFTLI